MKSEPIERTLHELVMANHSLSLYLDNLNRGRDATPHSWLYEKEPAQSTLQRWIPIMESANNRTEFGKIFNQFDLKQVEKFGPQGAVPPIESKECQEVIEPLYESSSYNDPLALSEYFNKAHAFAKEAFGNLKRLRPKRFESVIDDMTSRDTLSSNSGFPRFARRSTVKDKEIQDAESELAYEYPAIILFRQYNGKLRPVWMFPMSINLIEFTFSQPIQDALQNSQAKWIRDYLSPWKGYDDVKETLTSQWKSQNIDGGDTTKMDAHMRPAQIQLVYEIVKWLFQEKYWDELHQSLMHICKIDLLYSKDHAYVGTHGLASGSGWTQLTETVLQLFMAWCIGVQGQGIGDDFYWVADMSADELVDYLGKFGLPANPTKQSVSHDELTFLQRLNHQSFFSRDDKQVLGGYYPTIRGLNSMLQPEKFHKPKDWNSDMFCIRNYMILENCVDDPCFDEFLKFVVHGHRDMIPFAKKSASELDAIQQRARLVPGLNPSYNQEKREKPLSTFTSIQLAKRL
uniref:RNA-dependent RNA polymerase n=1 Tax=Bovine picobirnavirus TaxID=1977295 RepID=A0A4Y1KD86_9VIRU|nr:RNA-dependent RNA polymerase [Bovine picobirnavirus]